jgi:DNA-binding NarL/FixJ family response regulator
MTASPAPLRIAIGEDHEDLALALAMLIDLQPDLQCVGHSPTAAGVMDLSLQHSPDAYVLDLTLDDGSCIPLIRTLRARQPDCLIVAFSGLDDSALRSACRDAGCDATLRKDGRPMAVLDCLRTLRR